MMDEPWAGCGKTGPVLRCGMLILMLLAGLVLTSCAKKIPHTLVKDYPQARIRLIAVMPVTCSGTSDIQASLYLREKVLNALYFKGYPKVPLKLIDEKLMAFDQKQRPTAEGVVPPGVIGELMGVDAVLYVSLMECRTTYRYLYAPTTVAARFELRSAKTGATLWSVQYRAGGRNFDFTTSGLEMKSTQVYEEALQEVVERSLDTLPDGPDILG